ncbi:ComF family protein [Gorillibacterium timonense]|uniref:ComF family protein n=1 Tax=Gorillibacterium timonense TaxID=1689269 RepID=UPI00071E2BBE|nr:ComF family protein [Gorillibacterium timonense]
MEDRFRLQANSAISGWKAAVLQLRSAIHRFAQEIWAPPREECLTCKGPTKGNGNPLGICSTCFQAIPWITRIECPVCGRPNDCPDCRRGYARNFLLSRSAVRYDPLMKEWLAAFKYRGDERYARLLGTMLHQAYALLRSSLPQENLRFDCITFVPVSRERLLERGFNQAEQAALQLARHLRLPVLPLLLRTHSTVKQSMKSRNARFFDLRDAFAPHEEGMAHLMQKTEVRAAGDPSTMRSPLRILLVDDVYTTGSTMQECSTVLHKRLGAEVYGLTWAR